MFLRRLFLVFPVLILLAGCGGYRVRPLKPIKRNHAHFVQTKEGVEVRVRELNKHEVGEIFNGQTIPEASKIAAYAMTINNAMGTSIYLNARQPGLRQLSADEVFALLRYDYASKIAQKALVIGLATGGIVTAMVVSYGVLACIASCGYILWADALVPLAGIFAVSTALGTTIGGMALRSSFRAFNEALRLDIEKKILTDLTIEPHGQETRLFFARAGQPSFALAVQDSGDHQIPFDVCLKK